MITAVIDAGQHYCQAVSDLWQWDYGQTLRIQGVKLPAAVEVQFSTTERIGETVTRIGVTQEGVTEVPIPDTLLEGGGTTQDYTIYAFVYIENGDSGKTEYRVSMKVRARPKPEAHATPEEGELFRQAIVAVAESADRAESARKSAEKAADKAESAKNAAESASGSAQASADEAKTSKENAETAVKVAEAFKTEAEAARSEAVRAATESTNAKDSAEKFRAAAEKSAKKAEAAKEEIQESADQIQKNATEIDSLKEELANITTATVDDVGKALKVKAVVGGKVTKWEFGKSEGSGGDKPSGEFDTIVKLPYSPTKDTDVMIKFSEPQKKEYDVDINAVSDADYSTSSYGTLSVSAKENTTIDSIDCFKFTAESENVNAYQIIKAESVNSPESVDNKFFYYAKLKKISEYHAGKTNAVTPGINISSYGVKLFDNAKTEWQEVYGVASYPGYNLVNPINFRIHNYGEIAVERIVVVNITKNEMETKTAEQLVEMTRNGDFDSTDGLMYSATYSNGEETCTVEPFSSGTTIEYVSVKAGNSLIVSQNGSYALANIEAFVKSTDSPATDDYVLNTRFKGATVVFEGDSITDSDYLPSYGGKSWADYLSEICMFGNTVNQSLGGASISTYNTTSANASVVNRIVNTNYPSDTKLFFVFAGTNDWNANVALGDYDSIDTSTIIGALNVIIDTIQTKLPECNIVIMTPMHRSGSRTAQRTAGTMSDVANAYETVCERWGVDCLNTLKTFGMNSYNDSVKALYFVEQDYPLHPSHAGHKRIAQRMAGYISQLK